MYYNYFETGDLITTRVESFPLFFHKGLVVKEDNDLFIWHNTPVYNGVVKEKAEDFFKSREFYKREKTNLDKDKIESLSLKMKNKPFDLLKFNCEQYVYLIKDNEYKSPQIVLWSIIGVSAALILFIVLKNSKTK